MKPRRRRIRRDGLDQAGHRHQDLQPAHQGDGRDRRGFAGLAGLAVGTVAVPGFLSRQVLAQDEPVRETGGGFFARLGRALGFAPANAA